MDLELNGKTAAVLGASRGIGKAIALALAREGCRLAICARGAEDLEATRSELEDAGAEVIAEAVDVTAAERPSGGAAVGGATVTVEDFLAGVEERWGGLDVVVGNVGGNRRGAAHEVSLEHWRELWRLNVESHLRAARVAVPSMAARGGGAILFVASIYGREAGGKGLAAYNTTKSALISLAKILALDTAALGIRVNTVAPGSIRFPGGSWDRRCLEDPEAMARFIEQNLPLGRFGRAEEVADTVAFLASARASLITGACINVDGGQSRSLI